jgi:ribosomal protein S18 acetylase RimI-like enzyme
MPYKIRKAKEADLPRILELYEELTNEKIDIPAVKAKTVLAQIEAIATGELLVIDDEGFIAGTMFLLIMPNLSHNAHPWGLLENLVVDKGYHRQGIGKKLIEHAIERCRKAGCYKVQLMSTNTRKEAHRFYRALGFEDTALGFRLYLQESRD